MVNLLIVDDEVVVVNSLKNRVDWERLHISNVYTANSAEQARRIIKDSQIDILLCDIEMPQESGLDLLEWARDNYKGIVCVFLTCHEEFRFVKRALELESFDYILKPIPFDELELVVNKSIEKVMDNRAQEENSHLGRLWSSNRSAIVEGFWRDLISRLIPLEAEKLQNILTQRNIPIKLNMDFLPVVVSILNENVEQTVGPKLEALTGMLEKTFYSKASTLHIISIPSDQFVIILTFENDGDLVNPFEIGALCSDCMEQVKNTLGVDMAGYIGRVVKLLQIPSAVEELLELHQDHVVRESRVFFSGRKSHDNAFEDIRDISRWKRLFEQQKNEFLISEIQHFLNLKKEHGHVNRSFLMRFQQDFLQMTYLVLQENGISAHRLFGDGISIKNLENSLLSFSGMLKMVEHIIQKSTQYIAQVQEPESITEKTIKFIHANLAEELSRDDIANNVYLNSDYLSRLFKKETGMSLTDFITNERMKAAQEMLLSQEIPTYSVAERVGYSSYSYFSKIFRKYFNMTPNEYRASQMKGRQP